MKPAFDVLHGFFTDRDAFLVDGIAELHKWMEALPGHTTSPSEYLIRKMFQLAVFSAGKRLARCAEGAKFAGFVADQPWDTVIWERVTTLGGAS